MRIAVVEDETEAAALLCEYIARWAQETGTICTADTFTNGLDFISDYRLWFQMQAPGLNPDSTHIGWNDHGAADYRLPERLHPTAWTGETACEMIHNYRNGNGQWDPGEFDTHTKPEPIYYHPATFDVRARWDIEQDWDFRALPFTAQKPEALIKQKADPKKTIKNRNAERLREKGR